MGHPASRIPSFDQIYPAIAALPEGVTGEIPWPGQIRTMSRPGRLHQRVVRRLAAGLGPVDAMLGGSGWWIEVEPEIRMGERLFVPDLAGWRVARVPELPDENPLTVLPDWCAEVLSESTSDYDRREKMPRYLHEGVACVWLVDPPAGTVEAWGLARGKVTRLAVSTPLLATRLPPFDLPVETAGW